MKPVFFFNPSYDERNINFYNMGLISIASHLKRQGIPAYVYMNYLDERFTKENDYDLVLEDIMAQSPRYVGISCMTTQYDKALALTKRIHAITPGLPVVWGGAHVNAYHRELEHDGITCVTGWGETAAENLYYGKIMDSIFTFDSPLDFSVVVNYQPVERSMRGRMVKQASIMASYGCPYKCRFCVNAIEGSPVVYRAIKTVIQEIKQVLEMGADSIAFYDELFFIKKDRMSELMEGIKMLSLPWLALSRIDTCPSLPELKFYNACGCEEIHFGVESGSQRMIDECIHKRIKVDKVIPTLERVLEAGILPRTSFIIGMPGETIDDVSQTIYLMMEMAERFENKFVINGFFFYPIPGTPMTDEAFKGLTVKDAIDAARYSVHPNKLFKHFDRMYDWLPDKKFFAECWYIARVISEICAPYKYYEGYNPQFKEWGLSVSDETYGRLNKDTLSQKWLDKVRAF